MNATATSSATSKRLKAGRRKTQAKKVKNRAVCAAQVAEQVARDMVKAINLAVDGELADSDTADFALDCAQGILADAGSAVDAAQAAAEADNPEGATIAVADANVAAIIAIEIVAELVETVADNAADNAFFAGDTARDLTIPVAEAAASADAAGFTARVAAELARAVAIGARRLTATAIENK